MALAPEMPIRDRVIVVLVGVGLLVGSVVLLWLLWLLWSSQPAKRPERVVQEIQVFQPPPEPEKKVVENEITPEEIKPQDQPTETPTDAPAAPSDLGAGLDRDADAGSDSYHLGAGKGGGLFGRGGSDGGWGALIAAHITAALQRDERTRAARGLMRVAMDIDASGRFSGVLLVSGTGDQALDNAIRDVLAHLPPLGRQRPPGIGNTTQLSINLKRADS
jgi:outer membrane biosynthesis protein TonB